jgi:hypothetical protein
MSRWTSVTLSAQRSRGGNEPTPYPRQGPLPDDTAAELDLAAGVTGVTDGPLRDYNAAELDTAADVADANQAPPIYTPPRAAVVPSAGPQPPPLESIEPLLESIEPAAHRCRQPRARATPRCRYPLLEAPTIIC